MPEQDNDRLEQFFRKAATRADVTFNEDDWKKLEARLDAADAVPTVSKRAFRIKTSVIIGSVLLFSAGIWTGSQYDLIPFAGTSEETVSDNIADATAGQKKHAVNGDDQMQTEAGLSATDMQSTTMQVDGSTNGEAAVEDTKDREAIRQSDVHSAHRNPQVVSVPDNQTISDSHVDKDERAGAVKEKETASQNEALTNRKGTSGAQAKDLPLAMTISNEKIERDLVVTSPVVAERNKQRAVVELPGAEEGKTREAQAMVQEEHASDKEKHVASPRLSLLLSFAPDFSGTSGLYSAPGKAYGAVMSYHFFSRWILSAGIIKNHKQYTGSGEEYHPPRGYWKNNTNGVIPETIKGSCSILEYPIMLHYAAIRNEKSNWNIGAGMSSYLMQTESYRYSFDQPNPGAKSGWSSRGSSRFMFNMLNFTIGYERQIAPGLMIGIEPYAKIPLQEIGWSNLKLFSTGASVTVRYTIIRNRHLSIPTRSRGPD